VAFCEVVVAFCEVVVAFCEVVVAFFSPYCLHTPNFLGKGDNAVTTLLKITNYEI
jgi:hypothetical protein